MGAQGALAAAQKYLATTAIAGASGAAGNTIDQIGNTIGTDKGVQYDPKQTIDAALGNAAIAGTIGAPRAIVDATSAATHATFGGNNSAATAAYGKRLVDNAGSVRVSGSGKKDYIRS